MEFIVHVLSIFYFWNLIFLQTVNFMSIGLCLSVFSNITHKTLYWINRVNTLTKYSVSHCNFKKNLERSNAIWNAFKNYNYLLPSGKGNVGDQSSQNISHRLKVLYEHVHIISFPLDWIFYCHFKCIPEWIDIARLTMLNTNNIICIHISSSNLEQNSIFSSRFWLFYTLTSTVNIR